MVGYARVLPPQHLAVKSGHIICPKWGPQSDRLIENAAERPYVTLHVIRLIAPNLGTGVIRRAGLRVIKAILTGQFGYIQIAYFDDIVICKEDVC